MAESKDIGVRLTRMESGFATCRLVPSGKLLSAAKPQLPDLGNRLSDNGCEICELVHTKHLAHSRSSAPSGTHTDPLRPPLPRQTPGVP